MASLNCISLLVIADIMIAKTIGLVCLMLLNGMLQVSTDMSYSDVVYKDKW